MSHPELRIPASVITTLQEHLLQDELERIAFCHCTESGDDLLVTDVDPVSDEDMEILAPSRCRADSERERRFIEHCFQTDQHPLMVHSHPFTDTAGFSIRDITLMEQHSSWITTLDDGSICLFGVLGQSTLHIERWDRDTETFTTVPIRLIGDWTLDKPPRTRPIPDAEPGATADPAIDTDRYDRSIRCFLETGQDALAKTHIAIVGCGGIGSLLAEHVVGLGVQQVTFIDPDRLEASNIPRIPQACPGDLGAYKAAVLQEQYIRQVPEAETVTVTAPVQKAPQYLQDVDVILAGLDRITPRLWLNQYAVQHLKYYIDVGSRIDVDDGRVTDMAAYVQTIAPGAGTACFDCLDRGDTEAMRREHLSQEELKEEIDQGYIAETALSPEPAVIHLNGIAASLAAETFAKLITGYDDPPDFLHYDGLQNDLVRLSTHRSDACYTCNRFLATGHTAETPHGQSTADSGLPTPTQHTEEQADRADTQSYSIPDGVTAFFAQDTPP